MNFEYSCAKYLNIDNFYMNEIENDCTISIFQLNLYLHFDLISLRSKEQDSEINFKSLQ